jgi:predicted anti-sigma-YlaC factor YlaD
MTDSSCRIARPHFSDRIDGMPLPFWRSMLVRLHLGICPECKRFNRSLLATREALRALGEEKIDTGK